jgi:glutaredoxin
MRASLDRHFPAEIPILARRATGASVIQVPKPRRRPLLALLAVGLGIAVFGSSPHGDLRVAEARGRPHVLVYMTAWCKACQKHMRGLDRKGIRYRAIDIEKDPAPYEPIKEKLGRSTIPVTIVKSRGDQRWIVGANSDGVARAVEEMSK